MIHHPWYSENIMLWMEIIVTIIAQKNNGGNDSGSSSGCMRANVPNTGCEDHFLA